MTRKVAMITGITGQDGSYLAELLLAMDYTVVGMVRRTSTFSHARIEHILDRVHLEQGDLLDQTSIQNIIRQYRPAEIYNLAAQSFIPASFEAPVLTGEATALGTTRVLEAIREVDPSIRFYQASSSEMFGKVRESPQTELTPFHPRSPYGAAKVYAHWITVNYREAYDLFACSGILFNHESPRRGLEFSTRKISYHAALIKHGLAQTLPMGNMETSRDWGYAPDYVQAMWLMLQQDRPDDYVVATGTTHRIRDFAQAAFAVVDLDWRDYVVQDERFLRQADVDYLVGDASKAESQLGWEPSLDFQGLVQVMVEADMDLVARTLK